METRILKNVVPFAKNASVGNRYVFGTTDASDSIDDNYNDRLISGWEGGLDVNGKPPMSWFNAVMYTSTQLTSYLYQQGIPEYTALQNYYVGSFCVLNGVIYVSNFGTESIPNVGNSPLSSTKWDKYTTETIVYSDVNPTQYTNPVDKNVLWVNTTSGEVFICTDNTTDLNYWVGQLGTLIIPDLRVTIPVTTVAEWNDFFNLANPKAITYTAGLGFDNFQSIDTWKSNKVKFLEEFSCNITTTVDDASMDALAMYVFYKDGTYLQLVVAYDAWNGGNTDRRLMINDVLIYTSAVAEDHRVINFVIDSANAGKEIDYIQYDGSQNGANSQNVHNYIDDIHFIKATLW